MYIPRAKRRSPCAVPVWQSAIALAIEQKSILELLMGEGGCCEVCTTHDNRAPHWKCALCTVNISVVQQCSYFRITGNRENSRASIRGKKVIAACIMRYDGILPPGIFAANMFSLFRKAGTLK